MKILALIKSLQLKKLLTFFYKSPVLQPMSFVTGMLAYIFIVSGRLERLDHMFVLANPLYLVFLVYFLLGFTRSIQQYLVLFFLCWICFAGGIGIIFGNSLWNALSAIGLALYILGPFHIIHYFIIIFTQKNTVRRMVLTNAFFFFFASVFMYWIDWGTRNLGFFQ